MTRIYALPISPQRILSLDKIFFPVQGKLKAVEDLLPAWSEGTCPSLKRMAGKIISKQGKLIRPGILLLITGHLGYKGKKDIKVAAAVEAIHLASLIHDDIIDDSATRRGEKTALQIFGPDLSLLLGDFLFIRSLAYSLAIERKKIPGLLTSVTQKMIEGEIEELTHKYDYHLSPTTYLKIIEKKTACLFQTTCELACQFGHLPTPETEALKKYGLNLGLTFQIIDDLLDLVGNPSETGKPRFSDLREGHITLPLILALESSYLKTGAKIKRYLNQTKSGLDRKNMRGLIRLLQESGALKKTFNLAETLANKARQSALALKPTAYRQSLIDLVDFVLYRKK
ncbi:MAG: polyprenyl synthetase family protein [Candidatus Saccharicenans sp.]